MKFNLRSIRKLFMATVLLQGLFTSQPLPHAHGQAPANHMIYFPLVMNDGAENSNPIHEGIATYYSVTGVGACSVEYPPDDYMVAAMNGVVWDNASYCGAYLRVIGPDGEITVRVIDRCPECNAGHVDLSYQAFGLIADHVLGIVPITWQVVSPPISGPIVYHFKEGSNQWWTAIQIRNHRNPIAKFEYSPAPGQWVEVERTYYNYFVQAEPDMGPGPYTFRVTDWYGNVLIDGNIPLVPGGSISGSAQFPSGP